MGLDPHMRCEHRRSDTLLKEPLHWMKDKDARNMLIMCGMVFLFFWVELIFGFAYHSLALVADAFHMISDAVSLLVGFTAARLSKKVETEDFLPYGWVRAEILGGLINGSFLVCVCFFIISEAIERLFADERVNDGLAVFVVGTIGLIMNLVGMAMFSHSHSHSHSHEPQPADGDQPLTLLEDGQDVEESALIPSHSSHSHSSAHHAHGHQNLNTRAVFLHVMADALGSVAVIVSGLFIEYSHFSWRFFADPLASMIIVVFVLHTTLPLLKQCSLVLLQTTPRSIDIPRLRGELARVPGVINVHELHVWQLVDSKIVGTLHVTMQEEGQFMPVALQLKRVLHIHGIHATTIQPEYVSPSHYSVLLQDVDHADASPSCELVCPPEWGCQPSSRCCASMKNFSCNVIDAERTASQPPSRDSPVVSGSGSGSGSGLRANSEPGSAASSASESSSQPAAMNPLGDPTLPKLSAPMPEAAVGTTLPPSDLAAVFFPLPSPTS
eukprot:GCRY01002753.1.p1 GENE.GCRY01002753.1~~GCRY01002753.1.p1  ORF type:complete len:497 (+),score=128.03 GCRY01002753.1:314-1804(+)